MKIIKKMLILLGLFMAASCFGNTVVITNSIVYSNTVAIQPATASNNPVSLGQIDTLNTTTTTTSIANTTTNLFSISNSFAQIDVAELMLRLDDTNAMPFDKTLSLWLYMTNSYLPRDSKWLFTGLKLVGSLHTNSLAIGDTLIKVQDATDFSTNDLIWLTNNTNEYIRISGITGTSINIYDNLVASHTVSGGVARCVEMGGFLFSSQLNNNMYGQLIFTNNTTANIKVKVDYSK